MPIARSAPSSVAPPSAAARLFTASLQVARPIFADQPAFLWALFVDAGNASDGWNNMRPVLGYGVGLHWRSPVGPLRVDLAYGQEVQQVPAALQRRRGVLNDAMSDEPTPPSAAAGPGEPRLRPARGAEAPRARCAAALSAWSATCSAWPPRWPWWPARLWWLLSTEAGHGLAAGARARAADQRRARRAVRRFRGGERGDAAAWRRRPAEPAAAELERRRACIRPARQLWLRIGFDELQCGASTCGCPTNPARPPARRPTAWRCRSAWTWPRCASTSCTSMAWTHRCASCARA